MKIGVLGCGRMGCRRIETLLDFGGHDLMLYDSHDGQLAHASATYDLGIAPRLSDLWAWSPDAVILSTPPDSHLDYLQAARDHGVKAIFCEKPLALTFPPAGMLAALADRMTMVGANLRYVPGFAALKAGIPTDLHDVHAWFTATYHLPSVRPDYRESYAATTGALFDTAWHLVDLALDWFGPARLDYAVLSPARTIGLPDIDGMAALRLCHHNGARSTVRASFVDLEYSLGAGVSTSEGEQEWHAVAPPGPEMYLREMEMFLDCARRGVASPNPIGQACEVLRLLLEAKAGWRL